MFLWGKYKKYQTKKAEEELLFFEDKLGLEKKFNEALAQSEKIFSIMESEQTSEVLKEEMKSLVQILKQ